MGNHSTLLQTSVSLGMSQEWSMDTNVNTISKDPTNFQVLMSWGNTSLVPYLLTYLQFSIIKWAKQHPGQSPIDVKSNKAIQI